MLDGLGRVLSVLHDISDGIRDLITRLDRLPQPAPPTTHGDDHPMLLSVNDAATALGIKPPALRGLLASRQGPAVTRLGRRIYVHRDDLVTWLQQQRPTPDDATQPWSRAYMPGRIGSGFPSTSEPAKRTYCHGSHTEPLAASKYSGRAVCRVCRDDVLVNNNGLLRKHYPRWW